MQGGQTLHQSFIRALEADLRGLCADARRKSPDVKEAAEHVILSLKEADAQEAVSDAVDQAASVFCSACEPPDPRLSAAAHTAHNKIALRAVSSLHKLLTHRAILQQRLPDVLNALERLSTSSVDDNITLKVLQGLLSLLTVRAYIVSLSEEELSRAFSLLFALRSSRNSANSNTASGALSAISNLSTGDTGVIEQTAKAAFCQVSSDLFSCAAEAAVKTAVQREAPSGEFIPLALFPNEVRAAFGLLMDLCNICSSSDLEWLSSSKPSSESQYEGLKPETALEVLDDGLSSNIALFAGQPVFMEALTSRLCPIIHQLMRSSKEKQLSKALHSLVVTLVRYYWRNLIPDVCTIFQELADMASMPHDGLTIPWNSVFSLEAIRCILKRGDGDANRMVDLVKELDLKDSSEEHMAPLIRAVCIVVSRSNDIVTAPIPSSPVIGSMKPFGNVISNSSEFCVSLGLGILVDVLAAAWASLNDGEFEIAKYTAAQISPTSIKAVGAVIERSIVQEDTSGVSHSGSKPSARETLSTSLSHIVVVCDATGHIEGREAALKALSSTCLSSARAVESHQIPATAVERMTMFYTCLFTAIGSCTTAFGRSWIPILRAMEQLDVLADSDSFARGREDEHVIEVTSLKTKMNDLLMSTAAQGWPVCHDMVSALVQSSRQSIGATSGDNAAEELRKAQPAHANRFFAVEYAEKSLIKALETGMPAENAEPMSLWQLFSGHLVSVCTDSSSSALREASLTSLTRLACGAIACQRGEMIPHEKVILPFLDLLSSGFPDIRSGGLSSVHTILSSQGEYLSGENSWCAIINILNSAGRWTGSQTDSAENQSEPATPQLESVASAPTQHAGDMVSEGFRVVQVLANDFLRSLSTISLRKWIDLLEVYCRQESHVNVALTSLGLLWRTADYLAKSSNDEPQTDMWISLFRVLKDISMDERPEIRKCAIKTLSEALSNHGHSLSSDEWKECVEHALLPLLENVMSAGISNRANEETVKKRTDDVPLLMHHSRDTPRKQWNETRVLALGGVTKIITTALPSMNAFSTEARSPLSYSLVDGTGHGLWRKILRAASSAAHSRDSEVAIAGVSSLLGFLSAAGQVMLTGPIPKTDGVDGNALSPSEREAISANSEYTVMLDVGSLAQNDTRKDGSMREHPSGVAPLLDSVWFAISEALCGFSRSSGNPVPIDLESTDLLIVDSKALSMLTDGLTHARKEFASTFTSASSKTLITSLLVLAMSGRASQKTDSSSLSLNAVQMIALKEMEEISFGRDLESWEYFLGEVMRALEVAAASSGERNVLVEKLIAVLSRSYVRQDTPNDVKFSNLKMLLQTMWSIFLFSAHRVEDEAKVHVLSIRLSPNKTRDAAKAAHHPAVPYMSALDCMFSAMKSLVESDSKSMGEDVWGVFLDIVEDFLFKTDGTIWKAIGKSPREREVYNARVIDCIELGLVTMAGASTVQSRLLHILSRGSEEGEAGKRPRFVRTCQQKLFRLACISESSPNWSKHIADSSQKYVITTCDRVLGQFVADDQRAGRCPLPARRRGEVVFLLSQLTRMHKSRTSSGLPSFLSNLYPRLYECVESRDEVVRLLAREVLGEAKPSPAMSLGIENGNSMIAEKGIHS